MTTREKLNVAIISLSLLAIRFRLSQYIPASGMFSDDYGYLKMSIYFLRGDLYMGGKSVESLSMWTGLLYPPLISPWQLFDGAHLRHQVVFTINSILILISVLASWAVVTRISGKRSLLALIALASFAPPFLFSFYVMTENLLFAILALIAWTLCELYENPKNKRSLYLLLALLIAAPLCRPTGIAPVLGAALSILLCFNIPLKNRIRLAGLLGGAPTIIYILASSLYAHFEPGVETGRDTVYLKELLAVCSNLDFLAQVATRAVNQLWYLLLVVAFWPLLFLLCRIFSRLDSPLRGDKSLEPAFLVFAITTAAIFVAFCILHLMVRADFAPVDVDFIYGRYNDPAALLLLILGLAAMLNRPSMGRLTFGLVATGLSVLMYLALNRVESWNINTINISGLFFFSNRELPFSSLAIASTLLLITLFTPRGLLIRLAMCFFIAFHIATIRSGIADARRRAFGIAEAINFSGDWIRSNVAPDECIDLDGRVESKSAPKAIKKMGNVYRALEFTAHPAKLVRQANNASGQKCKYLFTITPTPPESGWTQVWQRGEYRIFQHELS